MKISVWELVQGQKHSPAPLQGSIGKCKLCGWIQVYLRGRGVMTKQHPCHCSAGWAGVMCVKVSVGSMTDGDISMSLPTPSSPAGCAERSLTTNVAHAATAGVVQADMSEAWA